ncbi:MAG TPA: ATP-binding protein [Desulfomonilaceae bacterium]|nr:ATP-binding protein [Desulfomonilaceae bacterium]
MRNFFERRFNPVSALTFALMLGLLCVPLMGVVAWNMYQSLSRIAIHEMGLQRLIGTVSHLSEFLTMSAQMAAATGDPGWESRYRGKERDMDQALAEVAVLAREEYHKNYAAQTKMAYTKIIELEALAFGLVRAGRAKEASELLSGLEYAEQKESYFQGINNLTLAIERRIAEETQWLRDRFLLVTWLGICAALAMILVWGGICIVLQRHFKKLKRTEEDLAAEKDRLAVTLRSIADGVISTDVTGRILMMNPVAEELTGWGLHEAIGQDLEEVFYIVNERTRERCPNPVERVLRTGRVSGLANHTVLISRAGTERIISDSGAPILDRGGNLVGAVLVFRDTTAQVRMEAELLKAEKLESVGLLAGGIAHDFNNLLTAVLGNLSLAKSAVDPNSHLFDRLNEAEKASYKAKDLTQQLLTFSKGGAPIKRTTRIERILADWVSFSLRGSNVRCEFNVPPDLRPVDIDEGQISQVINNLIINADQAMPHGGIIRVSARNVAIEPGDEPALAPGNYVQITVQDEGMGIPKHNLSRIFDPYFTTKPTGVGLGLSTSYSVMKRHDGLINVESQVGVGTAFHIYLPASHRAASMQSDREETPVTGKGKILLMDDDATVRCLTQELLETLGYEVQLAEDGHQATEQYVKANNSGIPFDAVILDLTIPGGMGGKEAIRLLQNVDPAVKAIVSSGYSNDPIMANFNQYGFSGVLVKPYGLKEISTVLHSVVNNDNCNFQHSSMNN